MAGNGLNSESPDVRIKGDNETKRLAYKFGS